MIDKEDTPSKLSAYSALSAVNGFGPSQQALRPLDHRHVNHPPVQVYRTPTSHRSLIPGIYHLPGVGHIFRRWAEHLVDDVDLGGMDGKLSGIAQLPCQPGLAPEPLKIPELNERGIQRGHVGR